MVRNIIGKIRAALGKQLILCMRLGCFDGVPYVRDPESGLGVPMAFEPALSLRLRRQSGQSAGARFVRGEAGYRDGSRSGGSSCSNVSLGCPYYNPHIGRPFEKPDEGNYEQPEHPLIGVDRHFRIAGELQKAFPDLPMVGPAIAGFRSSASTPPRGTSKTETSPSSASDATPLRIRISSRIARTKGALDEPRVCKTLTYCTLPHAPEEPPARSVPAGCPPFDKYGYGQIMKDARHSLREGKTPRGREQMIRVFAAAFCLAAALPAAEFDVVVYGGTSGGVIAAVSAGREGARVALLEPGKHLGGMTTGGLGATDFGKKEVVGGYSLEFYKRVGKKYGQEIGWYFEPHVAEQVMNEMAAEANVKVFPGRRLREKDGVVKQGNRVTELVMQNGERYRGRIFVDSSYEGDLMAQANVSYTWGREATSQYGESLAGVRPKDRGHQFEMKISAYLPSGELLPEVQSEPRGELGQADRKVQAYNFRMCLTDNPAIRVPYPKPENYDPSVSNCWRDCSRKWKS